MLGLRKLLLLLLLLLLEQMSEAECGIIHPASGLLLLLLLLLQATSEMRILRQKSRILLRRPKEEGRPLGLAQGDGLPHPGTRHGRRLLLLLLLKGGNQLVLLHLLNLMSIGRVDRRCQCMVLLLRLVLAVQAPRHRLRLGCPAGSKSGRLEDLRVRVRPARRGGRRSEEAGGVGIAGVGLGLGLGLSLGQIQLGGGLLLLGGRHYRGLLVVLRLLLLLLLLCGGILAKEGVVRVGSRHGFLVFMFWGGTVPTLQR